MLNTNFNIEDFRKNWDWIHAFYEATNNQYGPDYDDYDNYLSFVKRVVTCDEGENDGPSWIGVFELEDGRFCIVDSWCDYTGWDCQAGGGIEYYKTEGEALSNLTPDQAERLEVIHDEARIKALKALEELTAEGQKLFPEEYK